MITRRTLMQVLGSGFSLLATGRVGAAPKPTAPKPATIEQSASLWPADMLLDIHSGPMPASVNDAPVVGSLLASVPLTFERALRGLTSGRGAGDVVSSGIASYARLRDVSTGAVLLQCTCGYRGDVQLATESMFVGENVTITSFSICLN